MATNDNQITQEHKKTFELFTRLVTYSTVAIVVVLAGMALFLL